MAVQKLKFLGTDGQAVTFANSGYDLITQTDANSFFLFEDSWMPRGRISVHVKKTASSGQVFGLVNIQATDYLAHDQHWIPRQLAAGEAQIFYAGAGEQRVTTIMSTDTGILRIRDGANVNAWSSPAGTIVVGQEYILSVYIKRHETDGHNRVILYRADGTVVVDSGLVTGRNNGTLPITRIRSSIGNVGTTNTIPAEHQWGEPRWDRLATGILPAWEPHYPYYGWINGQYQKVYVYAWINGAYVQC